ncbi:MAG: winged helix-turn-helix domain-containing protein [Nitrososphaerales archaeon]
MRWGRRGGLDIFGSILACLAEDGPLKKTHVAYRARLDLRETNKYLDSLLKMGLIKKLDEDPSYYVIDEMGMEFLKLYNGILEISKRRGTS